jgi:predicted TIM-barrel fold metal-dependent hydrolase
MASDMPSKIDVHVHFLPPAYRQACLNHGHANPDGMPYLPEWSEEAHLELMDKNGIQKAILSISTPGTHLVYNDSKLAAKVTRECNSYAADLKKRMPDRFGYWASLPIPDVHLCLEEIAKSAEEGCDGYVLLTNGHGHYLGDPIFDPIFAELNKRKATLFIHPTTPCVSCAPEVADRTNASKEQPTKATPLANKFPNPMLEFLFDTARVVSNLFLSGTIKRCPDLKIILPHLAGASPPLLSRWTGFSTLVPGNWEPSPEEEAKEALNKQFWFDLAGFPFPGQIVGLLQGAGISHERLMYGSDFPFTKAEGVEFLLDKLDSGMEGMFTAKQIEDMYRGNAEKLLNIAK